MASSTSSGAGRGRRKQAKPQRKQVDVDVLGSSNTEQFTTTLTEITETASSMSPDTNSNETSEEVHKRMNGIHKQGAVPEEVLTNNGLSLHSLQRIVKTGGTADDVLNDSTSAKAAIGEPSEDDKLRELLQRRDTAVIYAVPVGRTDSVPSIANGLTKVEDLDSTPEYFIKCPQCQKGYQSFQALKEHMETAHPDISSVENAGGAIPNSVSPTPSILGPSGPYGCPQCATSFTSKDQLEKHELLHSPNAQVSCKICNKTFANVYRLQRHMISHDESAVLRKFKCTECEKAFKFKHHLKEHIRIHSGEKPFECGNCGKRFSHSGSYSSHMTSKKCLVMNLKLGRARGSPGNALLDKTSSQSNRNAKRLPGNPLNNNITTSPNHNAYLPILPKYTEAAAAFLHSSLASNHGILPFSYIPPTSLLNNSGPTISPYTMPSLNHILEQLQGASPHRPQYIEAPEDMSVTNSTESIKREAISPKVTEPAINFKSNSSSCTDLVMATEGENDNPDHCASKDDGSSTDINSNGSDLEAVKRILETVNASVTKQLLQANMQKYTTDIKTDDRATPPPRENSQSELTCNGCKQHFSNRRTLDEHECDQTDIRSEGLAAKLEDAVNIKLEDTHSGGNYSCDEYEMDSDRLGDKGYDYDMDCESVTTTDQVSEDGRKVRVRSLIADKQLKVLKDHYNMNPRPKREELVKIADKIGFPVRVVQVWFQNTRARDRREGRLIQVPYSPIGTLPLQLPPSMVPSSSQSLGHRVNYPLVSSPQYNYEQPLDLSTKKSPLSSHSSPIGSPQRPPSSNPHSDSGEEVVNMCHKSSRSPTPFHQSYQNHYQHSNSSSDHHRSPSPLDFNSTSKLARILAQPTHSLSLSNVGLVPMDGFMRLPALTQLINNRISNLSPTSNKRCWNEDSESLAHAEAIHDELSKRRKLSQIVLKDLNSPNLGIIDGEVEGQFICDQCDKSFSKQSSLARHKYEHSGQRPHKCDECTKAFKHKHHLTEHKRLHSGEKPFQCIKCLKRFSHSGSYSQHMNHRFSYCKPYRE